MLKIIIKIRNTMNRLNGILNIAKNRIYQNINLKKLHIIKPGDAKQKISKRN